MHPGQDTLPGRSIQISMNIMGDIGEDIEMKIEKACTAFQVSKRQTMVEFGFVTRRPGHERRVCYGRARRSEFPSNYDTARGLSRGALEIFCTDPRWYSQREFSRTVTLAIGAVTGQVVVRMEGTFEDGTDPIIELQGPATNPIFTNAADGNRAFRTSGAGGVGDFVMGALDVLTINFKTGEVLLNGVNAADKVKADSQWWALLPGDNTFIYTRQAGNTGAASTATLKWRDAYVSA